VVQICLPLCNGYGSAWSRSAGCPFATEHGWTATHRAWHATWTLTEETARPAGHATSRTLRLPAFAADALRDLQLQEGRDTGPVFATRDGNQLDAANVRREFRAAVKSAGIPGTWTPRELRHTFVSLMSDSGVPVEEIARLAGHTSSRTTELGYRHQLRPLMRVVSARLVTAQS
jgi:integrase